MIVVFRQKRKYGSGEFLTGIVQAKPRKRLIEIGK
jgi:hypothetical protein